MNQKWLAELQEKEATEIILSMNQKTEQFGLRISEEDAKELAMRRIQALKEEERLELGEGILEKLIFYFCDSAYIYQDNYVETIEELQDILYMYKNESLDLLSDQELLEFMKDSFEGECEGSLEMLATTTLSQFAKEIRKQGKAFFGYASDKAE